MTIKINGTDIIDQNRNILSSIFKNYTESAYNLGTIASGTTIIAASNGNVQYGTMSNAATTLNLSASGIPSSGAFTLVLYLTNPSSTGSLSLAFTGGTIKWQANTNAASSLLWTTTANKTNVWVFLTLDAGTNWYGALSQVNL